MIYVGIILIVIGQFDFNDAGYDAFIQSDLGGIRGAHKNVSVNGTIKTVHLFLGVPYAKPPVGRLRFQRPEPFLNFTTDFTKYNGNYFRSACVQSVVRKHVFTNQSEDCLYLNIYKPAKASNLAVMIWIHGGGFTSGSGDQLNMEYLAAFGNVIVITFNYRLGVFGFFSTMDENAMGNYGLWDQRLVFQWVKKYIHSFGGDPNRITIFGQSEGAVSCSLHAMAEMNRNLFQRVITQSGSAMSVLNNISVDARLNAIHVAEEVGCQITNEDYNNKGKLADMVQCVRNMDVQTIKDVMITTRNKDQVEGLPVFLPVVDGDLIKVDPRDQKKLETENNEGLQFFGSLDFLNGITSWEGVSFMHIIQNDINDLFKPQPRSETIENWLNPSLIEYIFKRKFPKEIQQVVWNRYTNWDDPLSPETVRKQLFQFLGDVAHNVPAVRAAREHFKHEYDTGSGNYLYHFVAEPPVHVMETPLWIQGATHADDLLFLVEMDNFDNYSDWQRQLSVSMMTYWANFAKTGSPNQVDSIPKWVPYNDSQEIYLEFSQDMGQHSLKKHLYSGETYFWLKVFPDLIKAFDNMEIAENQSGTSAAMRKSNIDILLLINAIIFVYIYV
ncbi:liver carboxylesterase 1F-like [Mya arenaria]|uniref:liver carboxylesterase 1F-like n=1 Tax=Mya arenaria TaxID=6604 RepID=UPI0022E434E0|nr:liver carboxylesterase 1F-like [Mya arenaria]